MEVHEPPGRRHQDVDAPPEGVPLRPHRRAAVDDGALEVAAVRELLGLVHDLDAELAGGDDHQDLRGLGQHARVGINALLQEP